MSVRPPPWPDVDLGQPGRAVAAPGSGARRVSSEIRRARLCPEPLAAKVPQITFLF